MAYYPRVADSLLSELLGGMGAILIEGPRVSGKTPATLQQSASSIRLDRSPELAQLIELSPGELLGGYTPRLVDEWQLAQTLWNAMRQEIAERRKRGQFILSGSAMPRGPTSPALTVMP